MTADAADPESPAAPAEFPRQFLRTAAERPDTVAVRCGDESVSYADLADRAARLAGWLLDRRGEQVPAGPATVGLYATTPVPFLVALVGTHLAGRVAVPLDPSYPPERIAQVVAEAGAALVLADDPAPLADPGVPVLAVADCVAAGRALADPVPVDRYQPASIVFTSGSTGVPKGITFPHSFHEWLVGWLEEVRVCGPGYRTGIPFAGSAHAMGGLLAGPLRGGTLSLYEIFVHGLGGLPAWLRAERIQAFPMVPTLARLLVDMLGPDDVFPDVEIVAMFGEALAWRDVERMRPHFPNAAISNCYGCTESGFATSYRIEPADPIGEGNVPAGVAMIERAVAVVDDAGQPVPVGTVGEIAVLGDLTGVGYWRRPDLSREVWEPLPDGRVRCRTGDRGRLDADGCLHHLGRLDHVVKISGNRVELPEVEAALGSLPGVSDAAVAARPDPTGDLRLVGYVVPQAGAVVRVDAVRRALAQRLPGYMLPHDLVLMETFPRLASGKVDRRALPDRAATVPVQRGGAVAEDLLEQRIAGIWAEVLGVGRVGPGEDFFDLGGDSMRAARLLVRLGEELGVDLPPGTLIAASTVETLAAVVRDRDLGVGRHLVPLRTEGSLPPLFVLHGGGGEVFFAQSLTALLGPDQPVYALQPVEVEFRERPTETLEELAARYLVEIRQVRPHGPYLLYGYSFGGALAFEIARQLRAAGEAVGLLAMGDTPAPWFVRSAVVGPRRLGGWVGWLRRQPVREAAVTVLSLPWRKLTSIREHRAFRARVLGGGALAEDVRHELAVRYFGEIMARYRPQPLDVDVVQLRTDWSGTAPADRPGQADFGWGRYATVRVYDVPGDHLALIVEPGIGTVAAVLTAEIARAVGAVPA